MAVARVVKMAATRYMAHTGIIGIFLVKIINLVNSMEICQADTFTAECGAGEVIVMSKALYGRIRLGKCIESDMGYLGCSSDVLQHFDKLCSNNQRCEILISDNNIPAETYCWKELRNHLEAEYSCVRVSNAECQNKREIEINESTSITSSLLTSCRNNHISFRAGHGQRLNISMLDFEWQKDGHSASCSSSYGKLRDSLTSNMADVCGGGERHKSLLLSNGNIVEFNMNIGNVNRKRFLLQIEVLGCSDVTAPEGAWIQREGNELVLGCRSGKRTWTLKCEGNQWVGVTGQCGSDLSALAASQDKSRHWLQAVSPGIVIFAVCSLLLFLASVMFTMGVCIHSKRTEQQKERYSQHLSSTLPLAQIQQDSRLLQQDCHNMKHTNCNYNEQSFIFPEAQLAN